MMKICFLGMSGVRAENKELLEMGLTLPGFIERSKQIASLFRIIENSPANSKITINWAYYEQDRDILESGLRFNKLTNVNFKFIVYTDELLYNH